MDYERDYVPRSPRYRDRSPISERSYQSSDEDVFTDSDDDKPYPHRRYKSRDRASPTNVADSDEDGHHDPGRRAAGEHRGINPLDANFSAAYIQKLERENLALHHQLCDTNLCRPFEPHPKPAPAAPSSLEKVIRPTWQLGTTEDVDNFVPKSVATSNEKELPKVHTGPSLEIVRYKKETVPYGKSKIIKDSEIEVGKAHTNDFCDKHVLTVTREFDPSQHYWRTSIEIFSPVLPDFLKRIPGFIADLNLVNGVLRLKEPFMDLFYNRRALIKAVENPDYDPRDTDIIQAQAHARLILDFMRNDFGDISRKLDDLEDETPCGTINYPELWLLYKPGTIVYSMVNGQYEAFVVDSLRGSQKRRRSSNTRYSHSRLDLTCFSVHYDGEIFGRVWSTHCISPFNGTKDISSLNLVPERFLPDVAAIKKTIIARGQKFWSLQGQQYREYTGELYSNYNAQEATRVIVDHLTFQRRNDWPITINRKQQPSNTEMKDWRENKVGQRPDYDDVWVHQPLPRVRVELPPPDVVVDDEWRHGTGREMDELYTEPYRKYKIDRPVVRAEDEYTKFDALEPSEKPDELALLLGPQHVHGYCLRDKIWKNLKITQLHPVAFRPSAWDRLVLDAQYKSIIQAMVTSYVSKSAQLDDLVAGKGSGLVALLHGPPGSGKTLTAECVADASSKPLYQVTCGDLGTDPPRLEAKLEKIFDYATTWGAILLLDEADIFLQDRDMTSLERNALVSIFLRTLDYFSGILFLTTNRVTTFDQAFQSRIHVTLSLPSLDQARRVSVWNIFVDDLLTKQTITSDHHANLKRLVKEKWSKERLNGRQIRNAMRTALVIAEKKGVVIGEEDVGVVLKIGKEFEGFLGVGKGVKGGLEGFEEVVEP